MGRCWRFTVLCALRICYKNILDTLYATPVHSCSRTRARSWRLIWSSHPAKHTSSFPFRETEPRTLALLATKTTYKQQYQLVFLSVVTKALCPTLRSNNNNNKVAVGLWSLQSPTKCFPVSFQALWEKRTCPSPGGIVRKVHRFWGEWNPRGTRGRLPVLQKWSQRNDLHLCNKNSIVGKSFCPIAMEFSALEKEKEKMIPPSKFARFGFSNVGQPRTRHFFYLGLIGSTTSVSLMVFPTPPLLYDAPHGSSRRLMITLNVFCFCKWVLPIR